MNPRLPREIKKKIDQLANVYEDEWQSGEDPANQGRKDGEFGLSDNKSVSDSL